MAKKSLEEMLSENTERKEVKAYTRRRAVFLTHWDQIEAAYKKGWSYMDIWQALNREGVFDFGYSTFLHYKDQKKRREQEVEREKARTSGAKAGLVGGPEPSKPAPIAPGSTKVEMPLFGQGSKRESKRF